MITKTHIEIYKKYGGDGDGFTCCASPAEKAVMDYADWSLIDSLVQDLSLVKKGLVSPSFAKDINDRIKENCVDDEAIEAMSDYAGN